MANTSYIASIRKGGRAAPGSRRINVTLKEHEFEALRMLAERRKEAPAGVAADIIRSAINAQEQQ